MSWNAEGLLVFTNIHYPYVYFPPPPPCMFTAVFKVIHSIIIIPDCVNGRWCLLCEICEYTLAVRNTKSAVQKGAFGNLYRQVSRLPRPSCTALREALPIKGMCGVLPKKDALIVSEALPGNICQNMTIKRHLRPVMR